MLYRILMRLAAVLVILPLVGLLLAFAISPGPVHLHMPDTVGFTMIFGPAALVAAVAWVVKPKM